MNSILKDVCLDEVWLELTELFQSDEINYIQKYGCYSSECMLNFSYYSMQLIRKVYVRK